MKYLFRIVCSNEEKNIIIACGNLLHVLFLVRVNKHFSKESSDQRDSGYLGDSIVRLWKWRDHQQYYLYSVSLLFISQSIAFIFRSSSLLGSMPSSSSSVWRTRPASTPSIIITQRWHTIAIPPRSRSSQLELKVNQLINFIHAHAYNCREISNSIR